MKMTKTKPLQWFSSLHPSTGKQTLCPQICTTPDSEWVGEYHCHNLHNKTGKKNSTAVFPKRLRKIGTPYRIPTP